MVKIIPLNMRREGISLEELEVVLIRIAHPLLYEDLYFSTDNGGGVVSFDPLVYCTRSAWLGSTQPWICILVLAQVPDETGEGPGAARLVLEIDDDGLWDDLTSTTMPGTIDMAVVLASDPDTPIEQWIGMELQGGDLKAGDVVLDIAPFPLSDEPSPFLRFTKDRYAALHR